MNISGLDIKLQNINDNIIIDLLFSKDKKKIKGKQLIYCKNKGNDIYKYLISRYNDSFSLNETLKRILYKIDKHPICPICGKPVLYLGKKDRMFLNTCSEECGIKLRTKNIKNTCLKKYNCINPFQIDEVKNKIKNTCNEKYGVDNPQKNKIIQEKSQITSLLKYGQLNGGGSEKSINKIKKTKLERYGDENYVNINKIKKTKLERYGDENYVNMEKNINTCLSKYGSEYYLSSNERKKRNTEFINKTLETKKKNKNYSSSKAESIIYNKLFHYFKKIICQYKSKEYPFACDFYIPEINTYIEYNGYYTHHTHPFNKNDINDINELNKLIELNKKHKKPNKNLYYSKIKTWTEVDIKKREIAIKNNLNFLELFTIFDIDNFLKKYEKIR